MKNLITYLLLTTLCIHILGAALGEGMHWLAHQLTSEVVAPHQHGHAHAHTHVHAPGDEPHSHAPIVHFLQKVFDQDQAEGPIKDLPFLNLWMLLIDCILQSSSFYLSMPTVALSDLPVLSSNWKSPLLDIPAPPPKHSS